MGRKTKMTENQVAMIIMGSLKSFVQNPEYYRHSPVGKEYSQIYEDGREALLLMMEDLLPMLSEAHEHELDQRAKSLVIKELKGE